MKIGINLLFVTVLMFGSLFAAEGRFDFSSRSASLALNPDSRVRLKYTSDGRVFGWSKASIVKTSGGMPSEWAEAYPDNVVITYDDAPLPTIEGGSLSDDFTLGESGFLDPDEKFVILDDLVFDGAGATLVFSSMNGPQFYIMPGKSVTLKNIRMSGITDKTFSLPCDSSIIIAENVIFELSENLTFTCGSIILQNQTDLNGSPDPFIFKVRGLGGQKSFSLEPPSQGSVLVYLGWNSMELQNVEFNGLKSVSFATAQGFSGSIGLSGNTDVNVSDSFTMYFDIKGLDNKLRILKDGIRCGGGVRFSDFDDSVLHFDFVLAEPAVAGDVARQLELGNLPVMYFEDYFLGLYSRNGRARVIFDDVNAKIYNEGANSFYAMGNCYIGANRLFVGNAPIRYYLTENTSGLVVEAEEIRGDDIENGIPPIVSIETVLGFKDKDKIEELPEGDYRTPLELLEELGFEISNREKYENVELKSMTEDKKDSQE